MIKSPLKVRCPTCKGTGVIKGEDGILCYGCLGKGWIKRGLLEHMYFPAPNQKTVFGVVMISTLLIGLMMASQAKFKFLLIVLYLYLWGSFAFVFAKIASFAGWVKSGLTGKKALESIE